MTVNDNSETTKTDKNQRPVRIVVYDKLILGNTISAPISPVDGTIIYTDGVTYNPGGGQGLYIYYNSTWNKL